MGPDLGLTRQPRAQKRGPGVGRLSMDCGVEAQSAGPVVSVTVALWL